MRMTRLGRNGPEVSALGLGCLRMSIVRPRDDEESVATIQAALDAGVNLLNTGDFYGMGHNEAVVGRAIKGRRDEVVLSVKFGNMMSPSRTFLGLDGRPNAVKNFASYSLQRLGVEVIDLYQAGRPDPAVPYEETVGAIADLIREGKVRHLGVSEVGTDLLRRAHAVHPVAALEIEYSLACRFIEADILPTARELGIGVVAYRVFADGILTGTVPDAPVGGNARPVAPRLEDGNLQHNLAIASVLARMAAEKGHTPGQLAIAWLLSRGEDIVPLMGVSRRRRLPETLAALDVRFTVDEIAALDQAFAPDAILGDRNPPAMQTMAAR